MVPNRISHAQLVKDFLFSYRQTGQLYLKILQLILQQQTTYSFGAVLVLKVLEQKGSQTQHQIAQELHHSDAAVSRQITKLLEEGLVSAEPNVENRREIIISLTQLGDDALAKIGDTVDRQLTEILTDISHEQLADWLEQSNKLQDTLLSGYERLQHEQA